MNKDVDLNLDIRLLRDYLRRSLDYVDHGRNCIAVHLHDPICTCGLKRLLDDCVDISLTGSQRTDG